MARKPIPPIKRLESMFIPEPNSGCWLWTASVNKYGYGSLPINGQRMNAPRAAWIIYRGPIPPGLVVCHKCDTPACVNPDHLWLGTQAENLADMRAKGRGHILPPIRSEDCHSRKINRETARQIFVATGSRTSIARRFGVSRTTVYEIQTGHTWRDAEAA